MDPQFLQLLLAAAPDAAPMLLAALRQGQMQRPPAPHQLGGSSIGPGLQRAGMMQHGADINPAQVTDFPMDMRGIGQGTPQGRPDMMGLMGGGNFPTPTQRPLPGSTASPMFASEAPAGGQPGMGGLGLRDPQSAIPVDTPGAPGGEASTNDEGTYSVGKGDMASNIARAMLGRGASMEQIMELIKAMAGDQRNAGAFTGGSNMVGGREMGYQLREGAQLHMPQGNFQRLSGPMNRPWSGGSPMGNSPVPPARTPGDGMPVGTGPVGRINELGDPMWRYR